LLFNHPVASINHNFVNFTPENGLYTHSQVGNKPWERLIRFLHIFGDWEIILCFLENTRMYFGDAKESLDAVLKQLN